MRNYFDDLVSELTGFKEEFRNDAKAVRQINKALQQIEEVVDQMPSEETDFEGDDGFYGRGSRSSFGSGGRSVFDDVDA